MLTKLIYNFKSCANTEAESVGLEPTGHEWLTSFRDWPLIQPDQLHLLQRSLEESNPKRINASKAFKASCRPFDGRLRILHYSICSVKSSILPRDF